MDPAEAKRARRKAEREKAAAVARAFLEVLQAEFGAGSMMWDRLYRAYRRLADERGWLPLTEMALSRHLRELGCRTEEVDLRSTGKGRPKRLHWPERVTE